MNELYTHSHKHWNKFTTIILLFLFFSFSFDGSYNGILILIYIHWNHLSWKSLLSLLIFNEIRWKRDGERDKNRTSWCLRERIVQGTGAPYRSKVSFGESSHLFKKRNQLSLASKMITNIFQSNTDRTREWTQNINGFNSGFEKWTNNYYEQSNEVEEK